jgi:HNH endonuclease
VAVYRRRVWQGEVKSATPFTKRAGAPLALLELRSADGAQRLTATQQRPAPDAEKITLSLIAELQYYDFGECPICGSPYADSREHVPNEALGGQIRTMTCARCNNEFGAKVEPHLDAYCSGRFEYVRFTTAGLRGKRSVPRVDMLTTDDGQFVLMARLDAESHAALAQTKEFGLEFRQREMSRVKVAVLKHVYLAACLALRQIPEGTRADKIRQVLVATRDLDRDAKLPSSQIIEDTVIWLTHTAPSGPSLALMARESDGAPDLWIVLAGVVGVQWPLPEHARAALAALP